MQRRTSGNRLRAWVGRTSLRQLLFGNGENGFLAYPSVAANLFQDSAGTVPVAANNDPIGRFTDQSGNGNNLVQTVSGNRPLWKDNAGRPYIKPDGVSQLLQSPFAPTAALTLAVAFMPVQTIKIAIGSGITGSNLRAFIGITSTGTAFVGWGNLAPAGGYGADLRGGWHTVVVTGSGGTRDIYIDGVLTNSASYSNSSASAIPVALAAFNNNGVVANWFPDPISAELAVNRRVTASEAAVIHASFMETYTYSGSYNKLAVPRAFTTQLAANNANRKLFIIGTSIGDEYSPSSLIEWVARMAAYWSAFATNYTVTDYLYNDGTNVYDLKQTTGAGVRALDIYNASVSGATIAYHRAELATTMPSNVDAVIIEMGHNEGTDNAATFLANMDLLVADVRARQPGVPIIIMSENPKTPAAANYLAQNDRMEGLFAWCAARGYGFLDRYMTYNPVNTNVDGIHPNNTGQIQIASENKADFGI